METLEEIKARLEAAVPGVKLVIIPNDSPSGQRSLLVDAAHAFAVAQFLRDDPQLRLDYCSNVTGVDWPDRVVKTKVKRLVDGVERTWRKRRKSLAVSKPSITFIRWR